MSALVGAIVNFLLGLLGLQRKQTSVPDAERVGRAETIAASQEQERHEISVAIDARRDADVERLRSQDSTVTTDPNAAINSDDGFQRRPPSVLS